MLNNDWKKGARYGRYTLTGESEFKKPQRKRLVEVVCDCGKVNWVRWDSIKSGRTTSCGCYTIDRLKNNQPAKIHGLSDHPLYTVYKRVIDRCYNPKHKSYPNYGGRGVVMCEEWLNDFMCFYNWAIEYWVEGLELDKDILYCKKNGGKRGMIYSPEYCKFVTSEENGTQKITSRFIEFDGITQTITEWTRKMGFKKTTIANRIDISGWSIKEAITTPLKSIRTKYNYKKRLS